MLLVPTTIGPSKIHGTGLFAKEPIVKGTVVWVYHPLDIKIPLENVPKDAIDTVLHYGYTKKESPDLIVLCFDDARFMNFGIPANTEMCEPDRENRTYGEMSLRASCHISAGEEITVPLNSDHDAARKLNLK